MASAYYQCNSPTLKQQVTIEKLQHVVALLSLEVTGILERNTIKDRGKEFEGSYTRVFFIMIVTYLTLFGYMTLIGTRDAYLNAIVPTLGFNISTWSLPYVKEAWMAFKERNDEKVLSNVGASVRTGVACSQESVDDVEVGRL